MGLTITCQVGEIHSERVLNESLGVDIEVYNHLPSEAGEDSLPSVQVAYLHFKCPLFLPLSELCFF